MRILFLALLMVGCASSDIKEFTVTSTPPGAQVDVNGISAGTTPTTIKLACSKRWVGLMVAPGGWEYTGAIYDVEVFPSSSMPGISQRKQINACQFEGKEPGRLVFDLGLDKVTPIQRTSIENK
jgi:hypothetical protein